MFHNDFIFIDNIEYNDLKKVRKKHSDWIIRDIINIIFGVLGIVVCAFYIKFDIYFFNLESTFMFLFILAVSIYAIAVGLMHMFYYHKIIGLTYGIVSCKQELDKYIDSYFKYEIFPWDKNNYNGNRNSKPIRSYVKTFYYVNVSLQCKEYNMNHVCCYKEDFDKIKIGDRVIIVRLKNNYLYVVPASENEAQ